MSGTADAAAVAELIALRLRAHRLIGEPSGSAVELVQHLLAVQAQDYPAARWAIGQRVAGATESVIDALLNAGQLLRTHVLRPTWHIVVPQDLRWLLALTGERVARSTAGRYGRLGLDSATVLAAKRVFASSLEGGRDRTRPELGEALQRAGIAPDGQRLPHLLMAAELDGLVISGPLRGRQHTYALLDERVPHTPEKDRDEALGELVRRYLAGHGPARLRDISWWSGLTLGDIKVGIRIAADAVDRMMIDGEELWVVAGAEPARRPRLAAHLLPNFDEYTVAYTDRRELIDPSHPVDASLFSFGSILANVVTIDGRVRGTWRRSAGPRRPAIEVEPSGRLTAAEHEAVARQVRRLQEFSAERP